MSKHAVQPHCSNLLKRFCADEEKRQNDGDLGIGVLYLMLPNGDNEQVRQFPFMMKQFINRCIRTRQALPATAVIWGPQRIGCADISIIS